MGTASPPGSGGHSLGSGLIARGLHWTLLAPVACALLLSGRAWGADGLLYRSLLGIGLLGAIAAAMHHSEVVAHRIGEPYGTLVLALAITMMEVALIVSVMISGGPAATALARDLFRPRKLQRNFRILGRPQ